MNKVNGHVLDFSQMVQKFSYFWLMENAENRLITC